MRKLALSREALAKRFSSACAFDNPALGMPARPAGLPLRSLLNSQVLFVCAFNNGRARNYK